MEVLPPVEESEDEKKCTSSGGSVNKQQNVDQSNSKRPPRPTLKKAPDPHVVSARNSAYWLAVAVQKHGDENLISKHQIEAGIFPTTNKTRNSIHDIDSSRTRLLNQETEEIYEHQRYLYILGWGSKGHLLILDPAKYTNASGRVSYSLFPMITLPDTAAHEGRWEWITPWHINPRLASCSDEDGWTYSRTFRGMRAGRFQSSERKGFVCRRRCWIRIRRFIPARSTLDSAENENSDISGLDVAFDDSFLDSVSGWLYKLGHIFKRWKRRYFELNGSVLRYYTDEKKYSLRGEILLFHPSLRVRQVDIHVSGKDNTFAIECKDYQLLLQSSCVEDREAWMYAIEDVILCRDSYLNNVESQQLRYTVVKRRAISADVCGLDPVLAPDSDLKRNAIAICESVIKSNQFTTKCTKFVNHFLEVTQLKKGFAYSSHETVCKKAMKMYREFLERCLSNLLDCCVERMSLKSKVSARKIDDFYESLRESAVYQIERAAFIPLQDQIYQLLADSNSSKKTTLFNDRIKWLSLQNQEFFDIGADHYSPSMWISSIHLLNTIDNYSLPSEKAAVLVEVAKSIYDTYKIEHGVDSAVLTADDFLPVLLFVLCSCSVKNVVLTRQLICDSMTPSLCVGETGYYVTMLEAAVEYIASYTHPEINRNIHTQRSSFSTSRSFSQLKDDRSSF